MSGDHEPWVFRGGLAADLQRLMPVDSGNDLFLYQYPESPVSEVFHIRPFRPSDEEECYRVCLQTWDDGMDASQDFPSHPTLVGEIGDIAGRARAFDSRAFPIMRITAGGFGCSRSRVGSLWRKAPRRNSQR